MPEDTRVQRWSVRPELDRDAVRYYVYRLLDADGVCLYVGRSCDPLARLRAHHASTAEWPIRAVQIEGFGPYTWDEAVRRERDRILQERPLHNIDGVTKNNLPRVALVP